ncbi:bromodomain adjacent to zinc finger domain protein 2B isoform X3 [Hemibagrus wyckioides]|uniref:bromodomain adjacent to zinc finger domain protein 2B isoform X3 n=1 Tax=Hemibagrus wyckioides TaxID=337641 RepID=UPI00266CB0C6|nr:bromodomain adjacent to zinc finger domain protein 2B isoform X3 [Hemibagrus wyckioides]
MESGERLPSSTHSQPSISSSATPPASSPNITSDSGHLFQLVSDPGFRASFPMLSHPAFRLYAPLSGCSDFRGLGILGLQGGLTSHPQLGAFPDWWRASDAQLHGAAALFPPLLGLPPLFTPPSLSQSHTPKKSTRGSAKGLNGAVSGNGKAKSASSGASSTSSSPSPAYTTSEQSSTLKSSLNPQNKTTKSNLSHCKTEQSATNPPNWSRKQKIKTDQVQEKASHKAKEKLCMTVAEISSNSDSQSGSSSDSSSDTLSSLGSVDLENEDDDEDLSVCSVDSDSQRRHRVNRKVKDSSQMDKATCCFSNRLDMCSMDLTQSQAAPLLFRSSETRDEHSKHTSVIQATGAAGSTKAFSVSTQPNQDAFSKPLCLTLSPKPSSQSSSPKTLSMSSSPKRCSLSASPKPLSQTRCPKPTSLSSSPNTSNITSSPKHSSITKARSSQDESFLHISDKQAKEHQEANKSLKKSFSASSRSPQNSPKLKSPKPQHSNLFLTSTLLKNTPHFNGVVESTVQDAPLALITKPRSDSSKTPDKPLLAATSPCFNTPINLSTGARQSYSGPPTSDQASTQRESYRVSTGSLLQGKMFREMESDIPSSKDSDDSGEFDDEEEDLSDSLSDSGSNLDTDSDNDEEDIKDEEMDTDTESHTLNMPLKLTKSPTSLTGPSTGKINRSSSLNLPIHKSAKILQTVNRSWALTYHSPSSSSCVTTPPAKRRRVTDEQALRRPLEHGWKRETRIRNICGRVQGEVAYYAPCGKKLKQYPDVMKYLARNGINEITRDHFSFSAKIRVGNFYEAREGPEGLQWCLLKEDEVVPCILAMETHRGRPKSLELQRTDDPFHSHQRKRRPTSLGDTDVANATLIKLQRKLEAQEIARQAAQIKMMRKLEKRALAQAAKEAKRQKALLAAEEKRKQKEQLKILKQQEKVRRLEQMRVEKELRAQQILEAKRKKKEEAINAKTVEAEKRMKEKELRRQQAFILKQQERERRKQHMMLIKVMEARKRAEERERLKQEKRDEKRLNKERKLELRRLELEMVKELNKPNEDLCLPDQKALPELSRLPGLLLPDSCFGDCLMVMQFLRCFGKVLRLDRNIKLPTLHMLQAGLLNLCPSAAQLQDLLIGLLSAAVCDPGFPPGSMAKTALGEHVSSVEINRENMSEILQIYMAAHCSQTDLSLLVESLKTKGFQAHTPTQKASIMAFLVNELASSRSVVAEIDKSIEHMTNLRREKCVIESSLRKLRGIYAKRTGKRDSSVGGEESQALGTPTNGHKRKRKVGGIEEDDDEDDDSNDQGEEEEDEEEDGGKKRKKTETCEEEDDEDQTASVEELEKQIEKLTKQQLLLRRKLFESSHSLQSMMLGQDRYKRRYWALPHCGGVFVESTVSREDPQGVQQESEKLQSTQWISVKEEPTEIPAKKPHDSPQTKHENASQDIQQENGLFNLFLQKPSSFSKLSKLLEVAKKSGSDPQGVISAVPHLPSNTSTVLLNSLSTNINQEIKSEVSTLLLNHAHIDNLQHPLHSDQLYRALAEKHCHWFSLLPRSPCDKFTLTTSSPNPSSCSAKASSPTTSNSMTQSTSAFSGNSQNTTSSVSPSATASVSNILIKELQMKNMMGLPFSLWQPEAMSANMSLKGMFPRLGDPLLTTSMATSNSESPVPKSEKSPALEMVKSQDLPTPQPIPEEMLTGWWRVSSSEELGRIVSACHPRGIRERLLQKQIQKHMEFLTQVCAKNKDAAVIDVCELEQSQVCEETVQRWCVEEHAMDMDIAVLQQVEELERRVTSSSLQVKGWMPTEPQSEREDLLYYEHKAVGKNESTDIVRRANNPLDVAVVRLFELERNIERRYLKSPLSTTIQVTLDNRGIVSIPAPATTASAECDGGVEELAPGMKLWRKALHEVRSGAQLSICLQQLQRSIAWERSIMKVYCQLCQKGDNEELLLLCDGCDKGCHTYCHNPQITTIPEGDWFCPSCIAKASDSPQKSKKQASRNSGGGDKPSGAKRSKKACVTGDGSENDTASTSANSTPKKGGKEKRKRKMEDSVCTNTTTQEISKATRDNSKDLELCRLLLAELQTHQDAWPFMTPVNPKSVPGYRKVIKKPMDFSTIQEKLSNSQYLNLETFIIDVNLVFENCEKFNEDDSDIGRAGHSMRRFFQRRWTELLKRIN